jgi:hypothetical protein
MTIHIEKTLPKSLKDCPETTVRLGDLLRQFPVARALPKSIKDSQQVPVKLGNLSPVFAARRV